MRRSTSTVGKLEFHHSLCYENVSAIDAGILFVLGPFNSLAESANLSRFGGLVVSYQLPAMCSLRVFFFTKTRNGAPFLVGRRAVRRGTTRQQKSWMERVQRISGGGAGGEEVCLCQGEGGRDQGSC